MVMSDADREAVAKQLAIKIYQGAIANENLTTLKAAVGKIDDVMNATSNQVVSAGYGATATKAAIWEEIKVSAPNVTQTQGGIALAYWALKEVGLL